MQARELISSSLTALKPSDSGTKALTLMDELRVNHLAVVDSKQYLGLISEKEILDWNNPEAPIANYLNTLVNPFILETQHLFDIIQIVENNNLSVIPILDKQKQYLGAITNRKLLYRIAKSTGIQSKGGILILKMKSNDYSMSEIARIVESNNTKILSTHITPTEDKQRIALTLKLNKVNITAIIKDFERFGYTIAATFKQNEDHNNYFDRYDSLMRFLNP